MSDIQKKPKGFAKVCKRCFAMFGKVLQSKYSRHFNRLHDQNIARIFAAESPVGGSPGKNKQIMKTLDEVVESHNRLPIPLSSVL